MIMHLSLELFWEKVVLMLIQLIMCVRVLQLTHHLSVQSSIAIVLLDMDSV